MLLLPRQLPQLAHDERCCGRRAADAHRRARRLPPQSPAHCHCNAACMPQHMPLRTEHAWLLSFARDAEIRTRELERAHLLSPHPYTVAHDLSFIVLVSIYTMHGGEGTAAADTSGWDGRAERGWPRDGVSGSRRRRRSARRRCATARPDRRYWMSLSALCADLALCARAPHTAGLAGMAFDCAG